MYTCSFLCVCCVLCSACRSNGNRWADIPIGRPEYLKTGVLWCLTAASLKIWKPSVVHAACRSTRWPSKPSSQPSNRVPAAESRKSCGRHFYRFVRGVFYRFVLYLPRAHIPNILTNLFYISVYFIFLSPRQWP